jgi:hypothetical protein
MTNKLNALSGDMLTTILQNYRFYYYRISAGDRK